jgi:hypothetical protein
MSVPTAAEIAKGYDQPRDSDVAAFELHLWGAHRTRDLVPAVVAAFSLTKHAYGRAAILSRLLPFARLSKLITALASRALLDRSYIVREHGCMVLAYSQAQSALSSLRVATTHADPRTQADALAAINAIESRNHNRYVDRQETGSTSWQVPHVAGL